MTDMRKRFKSKLAAMPKCSTPRFYMMRGAMFALAEAARIAETFYPGYTRQQKLISDEILLAAKNLEGDGK